jgi:tetratricopeptide (TPR) repeat protein
MSEPEAADHLRIADEHLRMYDKSVTKDSTPHTDVSEHLKIAGIQIYKAEHAPGERHFSLADGTPVHLTAVKGYLFYLDARWRVTVEGQLYNALHLAERAVECSPKSFSFHILLARIYQKAQRLADALAQVEQALVLREFDPEALGMKEELEALLLGAPIGQIAVEVDKPLSSTRNADLVTQQAKFEQANNAASSVLATATPEHPDIIASWSLSSWRVAGHQRWDIKPVLTIDDNQYTYADPNSYINALLGLWAKAVRDYGIEGVEDPLGLAVRELRLAAAWFAPTLSHSSDFGTIPPSAPAHSGIITDQTIRTPTPEDSAINMPQQYMGNMKKDIRSNDSVTDTGEIIAYLVAHAVWLIWIYNGPIKIFALLRQSGYVVGNGLSIAITMSVVAMLIVMILFLFIRQYISKLNQSWSGTDIITYIAAHVLHILWGYLTARTIYFWIIQNGYRDQAAIIQFGYTIFVMLVTLLIFLYARQYVYHLQGRERMSANTSRSIVSDMTVETPAEVVTQDKNGTSQRHREPANEPSRSPFDRGYD